MPIEQLLRWRIICTGCGAQHDYEGLPRQLPDGWTDDPASHQSMWFRATFCPACSEQRTMPKKSRRVSGLVGGTGVKRP